MSGVVYFLSNATGLIKIGYTADIKKRITQYNSLNGAAVRLLATIPGNRRHERGLHSLLSQHRVSGEWFTDCPEVRNVMSRATDEGLHWLEIEPEKQTIGDPSFAEALELANIILDASGVKSPTQDFGASLGLRYSLLWDLKYRPHRLRGVGVSDYLSLIAAARKATQDRIDELLLFIAYADRLKIRWDVLERQTAERTLMFEAACREWERANPGKDVWEFIQAGNAKASAEAFLREMDTQDKT